MHTPLDPQNKVINTASMTSKIYPFESSLAFEKLTPLPGNTHRHRTNMFCFSGGKDAKKNSSSLILEPQCSSALFKAPSGWAGLFLKLYTWSRTLRPRQRGGQHHQPHAALSPRRPVCLGYLANKVDSSGSSPPFIKWEERATSPRHLRIYMKIHLQT